MLVCTQCDKSETEVKIFKKRMICKKCSDKIWRENNKEKESLKVKRWRENNKETVLEKQKEWYIKNKEQVNKKSKEWYESNKEKVLEKQKEWYENNKERKSLMVKDWRERNPNFKRDYENNRYKNDTIFKLKSLISSSLRRSFNSELEKNKKTEIILGMKFNDFKIYLESRFESWMTWDNQGLYNGELNYGWDIDHIIPIATAKTEEDIIKLNHYTNLQPLCSKINRDIKRDKLN
jgi:hypothetical protein